MSQYNDKYDFDDDDFYDEYTHIDSEKEQEEADKKARLKKENEAKAEKDKKAADEKRKKEEAERIRQEEEDKKIEADTNPYYTKIEMGQIRAKLEKEDSVPFTDKVEATMDLSEVDKQDLLSYLINLNSLYLFSSKKNMRQTVTEGFVNALTLMGDTSGSDFKFSLEEILGGEDSIAVHVCVNVVIVSALNTMASLNLIPPDSKPEIVIGSMTYVWKISEPSVFKTKHFKLVSITDDDKTNFNSLSANYTCLRLMNSIFEADVTGSAQVIHRTEGFILHTCEISDIVIPKFPNAPISVDKIIERMQKHENKLLFNSKHMKCLLGGLKHHGEYEVEDYSIFGAKYKGKANYMTFKINPWREK